jgi:hypothetical protein
MAFKKSCSRRHKNRSYRGGNAPDPSSYSSGAGYGMAVNGPMDSQLTRMNADGSQSNAARGIQGQKAGGRRRSSKVKRGGFWGVLNQAIVPFSILGMQQTYGKRRQK